MESAGRSTRTPRCRTTSTGGMIRACAPELVPIRLHPALSAQARFGLVTLASKAEALYMPEIRKLMAAALH